MLMSVSPATDAIVRPHLGRPAQRQAVVGNGRRQMGLAAAIATQQDQPALGLLGIMGGGFPPTPEGFTSFSTARTLSMTPQLWHTGFTGAGVR